MSESVSDAFQRSVDDGTLRLERPLSSLLSWGMVGGLDVSVGVFALFVIEHETGSRLLGALGFTLGFLALALAQSELFTENFLVPINAVVAKRAPWWSVPRLWAGTAVFNLIGAWIAMSLVTTGFPEFEATILHVAEHPIDLGTSRAALASAILGGALITLMTWMERSTESIPAKVAAALGAGFLLAAAPLQHAIVLSVEVFAALQVGAPFGYLDWLTTFGWAALGNLVGGLGLVTILRLLQVGRKEVSETRDASSGRV